MCECVYVCVFVRVSVCVSVCVSVHHCVCVCARAPSCARICAGAISGMFGSHRPGAVITRTRIHKLKKWISRQQYFEPLLSRPRLLAKWCVACVYVCFRGGCVHAGCLCISNRLFL